MQELAASWVSKSRAVAIVPTMGYLHEGHLSLVRRARKGVGPKGVVVVSIYVNPTQFGPSEDLSRYPRDLQRDLMLCRREGVDVVFTPTDHQMYPDSQGETFSTYVVEERLSAKMEGASRPSHFRGVTTVVAKLFNIVQPRVAIFGAKDFQQARVVERMARDLNFPVRIILGRTVREPDGLAMSSRNKYLLGQQRADATILWKCVEYARARISEGQVQSENLKQELRELIGGVASAKLDYIELFDPETLEPVAMAAKGTQLALAVFIGTTRLIDNGRL